MSRLTLVQQDVIDRLKAGWELELSWTGSCRLTKNGEASRYVANRTTMSLVHRDLIAPVPHTHARQWVLVDGADA